VRQFAALKVREAMAYALEGGQALHVWDPGPGGAHWKGAPRVFRQNRPWAHLFDQDKERLVATVKDLGVRKVLVESEGTSRQHVDLCAGPLRKALEQCKNNC
jgi:hypothetical protein